MQSRLSLFTLLLTVQFALPSPATAALAGNPSLNLDQYTDFTTWNLYGSATAVNFIDEGYQFSILHLTQAGTGNQGGAAFAPTPTMLDFDLPFSMGFYFMVPPGTIHGDGMTFVLSPNDPQTINGGAGLVPSTGSDLGYAYTGLGGRAFAIDTFNFPGEPVAPSIQWLGNDSGIPLAYTESGLDIDDLLNDDSEDPWYAYISYVPSGNGDQTGILTGMVSGLYQGSLVSFSVVDNVDGNAEGLHGVALYYGFTAANGLADDGHLVGTAMPVPEPQAWVMMLAGLGLLGFVARARRA
ncbi:MAG TPA: PEP-CTERM sorting domain-containing protein [Thiobacillaceae bacterium]|nr:PEP-CTERM sorting domain-containing protein [Thiobacillaceae bacterium]HNU64512.1 PEP-CTERM sorting domain-containing protein [Thiobacillaceae bacterium]